MPSADSMIPDRMILEDDWSDLSRIRGMPEIDVERLHGYRLGRIRSALGEAGAALCMLVSPISLRYAVDCGGIEGGRTPGRLPRCLSEIFGVQVDRGLPVQLVEAAP